MSLRLRMLVAAVLLQPAIFGAALAQTTGNEAVSAGKAAVKALIGNTLVFTTPGDPGDKVALYILADGTGRFTMDGGDAAGRPKSIRWSIREDGALCVVEVGKTRKDGDCAAISVAGDSVTLKPQGDPAIPGKILKGNPRKL
ncbi:hypothetical protein E9232_000112 [Inquilinus ginsengisoli]|uniref:Uncharacterized protein n=1 Tax=Inquilinus ginsengisoli TaxID=363840 RepID=A0ABU1JG65_9PROT|nr:hypothetical protein [Inquilinus ginsengisoli]MDR6287613.1 hypothetical protein [Inquilinus ginsengisoli]